MSVCYLFVLLVVLQSHALTAVVLQVVAGGDLQSNKTFMTALMFVMFVMLKAQLHTRLETNHPSDGLLLLTLDLRVRFFFLQPLWETHQSIHVVAHVPEGDEGQSESTAVLQGDLVLPGHHRGHGPPGTHTSGAALNGSNHSHSQSFTVIHSAESGEVWTAQASSVQPDPFPPVQSRNDADCQRSKGKPCESVASTLLHSLLSPLELPLVFSSVHRWCCCQPKPS